MNRTPRVLLMGRHFWPHGAYDSAGFLFSLACSMHRGGADVEVVTPRFASSWPAESMVREIMVHRPAAAPRSDWSLGRYIRHLTTWLRQNAGDFDVLMADAVREEAIAAIDAGRALNCPVVVRCSGAGRQSDLVWWRSGRSARRCASIGKTADAVIAGSAVNQRGLIAEGFPAARVHRIDSGFRALPATTGPIRAAARKALATANGDLIASDDSPVVLCCSRMTRESGANLLVKASRQLITRFPDVRLWFVGDGPYRDWIYETLRGEGVRASIAMPGSFCDHDELFAAADVYLQPDEDGLEFFLPLAISAALPVVVIDNESTRELICRPGEDQADADVAALIQWIPSETADAVRGGISQVLGNLPACREKSALLRRTLVRLRPESEAVTAYLDLIRRLRPATGARPNPSVEAVS